MRGRDAMYYEIYYTAFTTRPARSVNVQIKILLFIVKEYDHRAPMPSMRAYVVLLHDLLRRAGAATT